MISKQILKVFAESKDKRIPQITEAKIDFKKEGVSLEENLKVIGTEADVAMCLRFAEKDARVNNRRMFPIPEPEPFDEFIDEPVKKEGVKNVVRS